MRDLWWCSVGEASLVLLARLAILPIVLSICLVFLGYGATHLILPTALSRWRYFFIPFVGYSIVVIVFRCLNTYLLTGQQCLVVVFILATVLNAYVLLRKHPSEVVDWREVVPAVVLAALVYAVAVWPLWTYGYLTGVGTNGDIEQYLATAEYLRYYSIPGLEAAAPNPLRDLALYLGSQYFTNDMGFSYVLILISSVLQWSALESFAPTIGFFLGLGVVAVYAFGRVGLGLSRGGAWLGAALVGFNGLILWSGFFNYGRQVAILSLLPIVLLSVGAIVRKSDRKAWALLVLLLAAVAVSYYPAIAVCLITLVLLLILTVLKRRAFEWRQATVLVVFVVALAPVANSVPKTASDIWQALLNGIVAGASMSGNPLPSEYLPLSHVYGLAYYVWPEPLSTAERLGADIAGLFDSTQMVVVVVVAALSALGLWRAWRTGRLEAVAFVGGSVILLAVCQFVLNDRYSHMKGLSFAIFVAVLLAISGVESLLNQRARRQPLRGGMIAAASLLVGAWMLLVGTNANSIVGSFADHTETPYVPAYLEVADFARSTPSEASVLVSGSARVQGWWTAPIAYSLMPHPLFGTIRTLNSSFHNEQPAAPATEQAFSLVAGTQGQVTARSLYDYAVLPNGEDPVEAGYDAEARVWANSVLGAYGRGQTLAQATFGDTWGGVAIPRVVGESSESPTRKSISGMYKLDVYNEDLTAMDSTGWPIGWCNANWASGTVRLSWNTNDPQDPFLSLMPEALPVDRGLESIPIASRPGSQYVVLCEARRHPALLSGIEIEFFDSDWRSIGIEKQIAPADQSWGDLEIHATAPPGTVKAYIRLKIYGADRLGVSADFRGLSVYSDCPLEVVARTSSLDNQEPAADGSNVETGSASVMMQFASLTDQRVRITVNDKSQEVSLGPGVWRYETGTVSVPASIKISTEGEGLLNLNWMQLRNPGQEAHLTRVDKAHVFNVSSASMSDRVVANVAATGPVLGGAPVWLEFWLRSEEGAEYQERVYCWNLPPGRMEARIELNARDGTVSVFDSQDGRQLATLRGALGNGVHVGEMRIVAPDFVESRDISATRLFRVRLTDGEVQSAEGRVDALTYRYVSTPGWIPLEVEFGDVARLSGVSVENPRVSPGEDLKLAVYWTVPEGFARDWRALVSLEDAEQRVITQSDTGFFDAVSFSSRSESEEVLRMDYALPVEPQAALGTSKMTVQLYSPVTLQAVAVTGEASGLTDRAVFDVALVVK